MIRYNTSNDRISRIIRDWCIRNSYIYSFSDDDTDGCVYPFVILAPSYAETDLKEQIRLSTGLEVQA